MTQFIMGFTVYTLGIIGLLVIGYVLAKYLINNAGRMPHKQRSFLKIEQAIGLEPRKSIYVLSAGKQKFLVATTPENVCLLSELDKDNHQINLQPQGQNYTQQQATQQQQAAPQQQYQQVQAPQPQMHPDLEAKLKYINFTRNLVGQKPIQR